MTDSASSVLAILFGLGVFAIIVAVGWRSVQNRRILRLEGPNGQETIIVALEDDDISNVVTTTSETTQPAPTPAPPVAADNMDVTDPVPVAEFGRKLSQSEAAADDQAAVAGRDRLSRVVTSTN